METIFFIFICFICWIIITFSFYIDYKIKKRIKDDEEFETLMAYLRENPPKEKRF